MMKRYKKIILLITILMIFILSACNSTDSVQVKIEDIEVVDNAINELLLTNNYSSEWVKTTEYITSNGKTKNEEVIISKTFHCPYKLKSEFSKFPSGENGLIAIFKYQLIRNEELADKFIYYYEDGSIEQVEHDEVVSYEWFFEQIKNSLVSAKYINEEYYGGVMIEKYEIIIQPYPFVGYYGLSLDKGDEITKIFLEEYKNCTGYLYIDTSINCISKLEFDLSDKTKLNPIIVQRIEKELDNQWFVMPDYEQFIISISFFDINDESVECEGIEKEIEEVMQREQA